jgi:predicted amino acid racemase
MKLKEMIQKFKWEDIVKHIQKIDNYNSKSLAAFESAFKILKEFLPSKEKQSLLIKTRPWRAGFLLLVLNGENC